MTHADTPMPGEDPGALIEENDEGNPQPQAQPHPDIPEEDDSAVKDTEQQPT